MEYRWKFLAIYVGIAIAFVISLLWHPYSGSFVLKALPAVVMAILIWRTCNGAERKLLSLGFLFAALGDVFLDLDRVQYFRHGLIAFLMTQVLYCVAFWKARGAISRASLLKGTSVVIYSGVMVGLLLPQLGMMTIPVLVYILALTSMGVTAALRKGSSSVYLGAFLFVIADSLIAIDKFLKPFDHSLMVIITLYMTGQFFIGKGVTSDRKS